MQTSHARGDKAGGGSRLGGARADFVGSLGRKVADLRATLVRVRATPEEAAARDELRRKLHALGSGAKLMKFDAMERAIAEGIGTLDRTGQGLALDARDVEALEQLVDDLPALAWGDGPTRSSVAEEREKAAEPTHSVLVVGRAVLADALLEPAPSGHPTFACESTPDAQAAFDLARSLDPDLVVLDADLPYAAELVEALMDHPATDRLPVVVVGSFLEPAECSRYVAMGVARTITKPTSRETLREACEEAIDARRPVPAVHALLGDPTLAELGDKLAAELRDALVSGLDGAALARKIPLGQGADVLGPLWGAIARVREVVTARTDGAVRFTAPAPEGALAIAPLVEPDRPHGDRARARQRGPAAEVRLSGRRVLVADDDPAVVWFLADLLKTAGCVVHEAFDGKQALESAYRSSPDLVLSDILMPEMDGFSLCRALRRDVALRDVPVVLLSWKEDLLQRVRELGAGAAGYVRKESDTRAILARMREALRPRAHVEARLRDEPEVRGRLDGVSVRTLLEIVCATRPEARVSVRDASFLYEVEIRWGAPQRAIRTAGDGSCLRGPRVLAAMLGVGAGRFTVSPSTSAIEGDLEGSLAAQLARPVSRARAATALLTGPTMMTVERVELARDCLDDYLRATPRRAQEVVRRIAEGTAPRSLVLEGVVEPSFVEDLVGDLAARGLVTGVLGNGGVDLFEAAVARVERHADAKRELARATPAPAPADDVVAPARAACASDVAPLCESPLPGAAGSLEDAVLREVNRSPEPLEVKSLPSAAQSDDEELDEDGTPSREEILAFAEPTVVDETRYGEDEASIPVDEASRPLPEELEPAREIAPTAERVEAARTAFAEDSDPEGARTPFAAVTTSVDGAPGEAAAVPAKRKLWPMIVFVIATAIVAWAFLHHVAEATRAPATNGASPPPAEDPLGVTYAAPTAEATLAPGHGVLEITTSPEAVVVVDGTERGRGVASLPLAAGQHDVRVKPVATAAAAHAAPRAPAAKPATERADDERGCTVEVRAGRVARLRF